MAANFGLGFTRFSIDESHTTIFDLYPTLLFTFKLSETVDFTLSPKVVTRHLSSNGSSETDTMPGGTLTMSLGPVMPEIGYYAGKDTNFFTYGVGFVLKH